MINGDARSIYHHFVDIGYFSENEVSWPNFREFVYPIVAAPYQKKINLTPNHDETIKELRKQGYLKKLIVNSRDFFLFNQRSAFFDLLSIIDPDLDRVELLRDTLGRLAI